MGPETTAHCRLEAGPLVRGPVVEKFALLSVYCDAADLQ